MKKINFNNKSVVKIFTIDQADREEAYASKLVDELVRNMQSREVAARTIFDIMESYSTYLRNINTEWYKKKVAGGLNYLATEVLKMFEKDFEIPKGVVYLEHKTVTPQWDSSFDSAFDRITADVANDHYFIYRVVKITLASILCYIIEKELLSSSNIYMCIFDAIRELSKSENNCF